MRDITSEAWHVHVQDDFNRKSEILVSLLTGQPVSRRAIGPMMDKTIDVEKIAAYLFPLTPMLEEFRFPGSLLENITLPASGPYDSSCVRTFHRVNDNVYLNCLFLLGGRYLTPIMNIIFTQEGHDEDLFRKINSEILDMLTEPEPAPRAIHLIIEERGSLSTRMFNIDSEDVDLELNYGSEFLPVHAHIVSTLLKDKGKGILLLHGAPGTGKTSYVRQLLKECSDKRIIFLPPHLCDHLSSPQLIPLLLDNRNSILVIEDAERAIQSRETGNVISQQSVSNLLNIADGILGDCLNLQIIATFNTNRSHIDEALLREGRLIAIHEFKALPAKEAQKLSDSLGFKTEISEAMTLASIYNQKAPRYAPEVSHKPIGFKR